LSYIEANCNRGFHDFNEEADVAPINHLSDWKDASPSLFAIAANWIMGRRRHGF
jgi:hypothetical protein